MMWRRLGLAASVIGVLGCGSAGTMPAGAGSNDGGGDRGVDAPGADISAETDLHPEVGIDVGTDTGADVITRADAAPGTLCKRGIATNVAPAAALFPGVGWWYNWSNNPTGVDVGVAFVPMIWDETRVNAAIPAGADAVLGFNEPNFKAQANLSAQDAASAWRTMQANPGVAGLPLVSPAVNFCGPAASCNGTDPYQYLKDFFAACPGCRVDHIAVHWYNCDLASLRDYLEPGGSLEGFEQFGRPIWVTELACAIGGDTSVAGQEAYMRQIVPYLEGNPHVARYAWFSADPIPAARLMNPDGSVTALGRVYAGLNQGCR